MATELWIGGINVNDLTNYALSEGWQPRVGRRRKGRLGGRGVYEMVMEEIPVRVFGTTAAQALSKLHELTQEIDQAERWRLGQDVSAVLVEYKPDGSGLGARLKAACWGSPDNAENLLELPVTFNEWIRAYEINPVRIPIKRAGLWLDGSESPAASAASTHPTIKQVIFSNNLRLPAPVSVTLSGFTGSFDSGSNPLGSQAYLVVASNSLKIKLVEAETATAVAPGSGTFNTAVDTGASNGNIRKLVPNSLGSYTLSWTVSPAYPNSGNNVYVFLASLRNNSSTVRYTITASLTDNIKTVSSPPVVVDTTKVAPQIVRFDPLVFDGTVAKVVLTFSPSATGNSSHALDVDYFEAVQISDDTDRIIALDDINKASASSGTLQLNDNAISKPKAEVIQNVTGGSYKVSYKGDIYLVSQSDRIAVSLLGTTDVEWRIVNGTIGSSPTAVSSALTVARYTGYLVPQ